MNIKNNPIENIISIARSYAVRRWFNRRTAWQR